MVNRWTYRYLKRVAPMKQWLEMEIGMLGPILQEPRTTLTHLRRYHRW